MGLLDILGAVFGGGGPKKPRLKTQIVHDASPLLRKKYSRVKLVPPRLGNTAQSIKQAQIVAARTIDMGRRFQKAAKMPQFADLSKFGGKGDTKLRTSAVADAARKAAALKLAQQHGGGKTSLHVLGAVKGPPSRKGFGGARKLTPTEFLRLGLQLESLGKKLLADSNKRAGIFRADRSKFKARVLKARKLRVGGAPTKVHGDELGAAAVARGGDRLTVTAPAYVNVYWLNSKKQAIFDTLTPHTLIVSGDFRTIPNAPPNVTRVVWRDRPLSVFSDGQHYDRDIIMIDVVGGNVQFSQTGTHVLPGLHQHLLGMTGTDTLWTDPIAHLYTDPSGNEFRIDGLVEEMLGQLGIDPTVTDPENQVLPQDQPVQLTAADIGTKGPDPATLGLPPPPKIDDVRKQRIAESMPDPGSKDDLTVYSSSTDTTTSTTDGTKTISTGPIPDGAVMLNTDQQPLPRDYFDVGSHAFFYEGGAGIYFTPSITYDTGGSLWSKGGGKKTDPAAYRRDYGNVKMPVVVNADGVDLGALSNTSLAGGWGPLVGRPKDWTPPAYVPGARDWTDGLRLDVSTGQFFWYRDHAPTWATLVQDQLDLQQATLDWNAAYTQAVADWAAKQAADQTEPPKLGDETNNDITNNDPYWQQQFDQPPPTDPFPPPTDSYPLDGGGGGGEQPPPDQQPPPYDQGPPSYDQQPPLTTQPFYGGPSQYLPPTAQYGDARFDESAFYDENAPTDGYAPEDQGVDWGDSSSDLEAGDEEVMLGRR